MRTWLGALAILASAAVFADTDPGQHDMCMQDLQCRPATSAELAEMRGGFQIDTRAGRLRVDIGITRGVAVNDRLVAANHLMVPDLGQQFANLRRGQGASSQLLINNTPVNGPMVGRDTALIVQNGPGNFAPLPAAFHGSALPTIVQNTLDNQNLKTFTLINASVNSLSVMTTLRMGDLMRRATTASGR